MASLTLKSGTPIEVKSGLVELEGPCVVLRELNTKTGTERMVYAYHLQPGEVVRCVEGDKYIVEY